MGRKANWPPKVYAHKARGLDRVVWDGRTYYLGKTGSPESRARYCELIRELEASGAHKPPGPTGPGEGTVRQVVELWRVHAQAERSEAELENYRCSLRPLLALYGGRRVAEFDALALLNVQREMVRIGWCRNHANRSIIRVRTVWRWAEMEQLVLPGTWAALRAVPPLNRPRPGTRESRKVQPVEGWRAFRAALASSPGLRRFILLAWWTGARPGELMRLEAGAIDRSGETWSARVVEHKNAWRGQERTLWFGPEARNTLSGAEGLICPNGRGGRFNRRSLRQALARACRRAGVAPFTPYQLRHAFRARVTRLAGLDAARVLMGHRSAATTSQYASESDGPLAMDAIRKAG